MIRIKEEIKKIEEYTKEDVLVYYAEISKSLWRDDNKHRMSGEDRKEILKLMTSKEDKKENLYFVIQTGGGKIAQCMSLIDNLKKYYNQIHFVVLTYAGSCGAYLCLCGDKLYMRGNATMSDFGPQNWYEGFNLLTAEGIKEASEMFQVLYENMSKQLDEGTLDGCPPGKTMEVIKTLGGPCHPTTSISPNGMLHGTQLPLEYFQKLIGANVDTYLNIPSPGNNTGSTSDNFSRLNKMLRNYMRQEKLAKVILFNGESSELSF